MDVRAAFHAYRAASNAAAEAERRLSELAQHADAAPGEEAFTCGVAMARLRLARAAHRHAAALSTLTDGRALHEVLWSLPDDL